MVNIVNPALAGANRAAAAASGALTAKPAAPDPAAAAAAWHAKVDAMAKANGLGQYATTVPTSNSGSTPGEIAGNNGPARDILLKQLQAWGIDTTSNAGQSISSVIEGLVQNGTFTNSTSGDQIQLYLQDTPEWKQRFAGNDARAKAGLAPLSPSEYISAESSYQQVLKAAGLPEGFYDHPDDFAKYIGANISPSEVQTRASNAVSAASNTDPAFRKMLSDYGYNLDNSQLAAYMLDPTRALPTIQRQLNVAKIATIAGSNGFGLDPTTGERINDMGLSDYQLATQYGNAGQVVAGASRLGSIYGDAYGKGDAQNEFIFNDQEAARRRAALTNKEQSSFSGSGAAGKGSLSQNTGGY